MTPKAHLIGYDYSIYNDLFIVVVWLCFGMIACSVWLVYRKRSRQFIATAWAGFLLLLLLGTIGISTFIHAQRLTWRDTCATLVASYASMLGHHDHWKIQPGNPEVFSDWSEPFILSPGQPMSPFSGTHIIAPGGTYAPAPEKLAVPKFLTASWSNFHPKSNLAPPHVQRRNEWAVAALTDDSEAYRRSSEQIHVEWSPVFQASTYRLQWKDADREDTEWITVYTGARTFCILTAPEGATPAFRIRAEDGTPEDDPHFNQIIDALDFPAATNVYVGYAYTMRFVDEQQLQFIVAPISDGNKNGFIDADEVPNDIGELFPATPLTRHIREHKERAMYFDVFEDRWGKWFVIAEPISTPDGKMDGFLAMDFRVDAVYRAMFLERIYPLCLFALVILVYFGAVLFINHLQIEAQAISQLAGELQHTVSELTEAKDTTEKALQAKTLFLTNMSHEFRTPLNAMLGYTEVLAVHARKCMEEERALCAESIRQMRENGKHLLELVDNLLGVAAMDGTQAPLLTLEPVHLRDLILEVAEMMRSRAEHKSLVLTVSEPQHVPEWITSDSARLRQVLVLLVDNAIKFTPAGTITIDYGQVDHGIDPERQSPGVPMFYVSIIDTGIGIDSDRLPSIFKPFSQTDPTLTREYGGTGIGLAVARQTAEILNGRISVESQLDKGSTFTFTFPGQIAEQPPQEKSDVQSSVALPVVHPSPSAIFMASSVILPLAGCRILYVEDTKVNQIVLERQLEKRGAIVRTAENGQLGIDIIADAEAQGKPFNVVLMDMQMPVLDGYEATRQLRASGYSKPIIAVTAHALPGDREKTLEAGCDDYMSKPVDFAQLTKMIQQYWEET